jgi:hypothetical protein
MDQANNTIERVRVREVTGLFQASPELEAAVDDLLFAGCDRADIDYVAGADAIRKRLANVSVAPEEVPDIPGTPRQSFFTGDDVTTGSVRFGANATNFATCLRAPGSARAIVTPWSLD